MSSGRRVCKTHLHITYYSTTAGFMCICTKQIYLIWTIVVRQASALHITVLAGGLCYCSELIFQAGRWLYIKKISKPDPGLSFSCSVGSRTSVGLTGLHWSWSCYPSLSRETDPVTPTSATSCVLMSRGSPCLLTHTHTHTLTHTHTHTGL